MDREREEGNTVRNLSNCPEALLARVACGDGFVSHNESCRQISLVPGMHRLETSFDQALAS